MSEFSSELVSRLQRYFKEKHNKDLSEEEAQEYLRAYADAFLAFAPEDR